MVSYPVSKRFQLLTARFIVLAAFVVSLLPAQRVFAQSEWIRSDGGSWSAAANWSLGVPNSVGAQATFPTNSPSVATVIDINSPITLGTLTFGNTRALRLNGTGPLFFDQGGASSPELRVIAGAARPTIGVPIQWSSTQPLVTRLVASTSLEIASSLGAGAGALIHRDAGELILSGNNALWAGDLDIDSGIVRVTSANGLGTNSGLTRIHTGGTLRLAGNFSFATDELRLDGGKLRGNTATQPAVVTSLELLKDSEIAGGLRVTGEIRGAFGLILSDSGTRLQHDNSYTGQTRVRGDATAEATLALGSPDVGTVIEQGGILSLQTVVPELFELNQGKLRFFPSAFDYAQPITSLGGEILLNNHPEFRSPLVLQGGTTTISNGERYIGNVSGTGNLVLQNTLYDGTSLAHQGNVQWVVSSSDLVLDKPYQYTGSTSIVANDSGRTVTLSNASSLGIGTAPLSITGARLNLAAPIERDVLLIGGGLEIQSSASTSSGKIILRESSESQMSEIMVQTDVMAPMTIESGVALIRSGVFRGVIDGPGRVIVNGQGAQFDGANAYVGTTEIYNGQVIVNHATGLGRSDYGTVVTGGRLTLNTSTAEPITVAQTGEVIVNQPLPRLPVIGERYGRWNGDQSAARIQVNVGGEFRGTTMIGDGTLEINSQVTLDDLLLNYGSAGIQISPDQTLTVTGDFLVKAGQVNIQGNLVTSSALEKRTSGRLQLRSLSNYSRPVHILEGMATAWSDTALGTADGPTVVGATNATLRIADGINLADRIELQNAQGIEIEGGLSFGNLRNSNQPSTLSGPSILAT